MNYRWLAVICLLVFAASHPAWAEFEVNLNKGLAAYLKKDYGKAVKPLEDALAENPNSATANHILGLSLSRLGRYKDSVKYLERAKDLDPNIKGIHLDLGIAYLKVDDLNRALGEFEEAVGQDPESGLAYYSLGYTHYRLGNYKEATIAFDKASKLDPDFATQSRFYSGLSRYKLGDYVEAKTDFQSARELGAETDFGIASEEYLNAISRLNKKYYGTVSIGGLYDSNVSLDPDGIEIVSGQSDVSAFFFLNLGYKPYFKPDAEIGADYKGYFSFHKDLEEFNIQEHRLSLYGEKTVYADQKPVGLSLDYFYDIVFIDGSPADDLFSQSHSVSPGISFQWRDYTRTEFFYEFRYYDFEDLPERDAVNNNFTIAQAFSLYNGRLFLRPGINIAINSAKDIEGTRNFDYFAPQVFLEGIAVVPFGLTVYANAYYFREDYYNDPFDRVDNQIGARVVVSKKLYKILYLDLAYQHISNLSSSDFPGPEPFEYSRDILSAAFTARF